MRTNFSYINCRNFVHKGRIFSLKVFLCQNFVYFYLFFPFLHPFSICIGRIFSPAGKFSAGTGLKNLGGSWHHQRSNWRGRGWWLVAAPDTICQNSLPASSKNPFSAWWKSIHFFLDMYSLSCGLYILHSIMSKAKKI